MSAADDAMEACRALRGFLMDGEYLRAAFALGDLQMALMALQASAARPVTEEEAPVMHEVVIGDADCDVTVTVPEELNGPVPRDDVQTAGMHLGRE